MNKFLLFNVLLILILGPLNTTGATSVGLGGFLTSAFTVNSPTSITAKVSSGASGNVVISTLGGVATTVGFIFVPAPTITSFTPTSATLGATMTIAGSNFSGVTAVKIGGLAAQSYTVVSPTTILAVVGATSSGGISVTTSGGTSTLAGFTYIIPVPTITGFTPTSAKAGTIVTITGTNLTGATAVSFGGVAASSFSVISSTTITAVVGQGATGNVSVTTPGGTITMPGFTFLPVPTVTSFTPSYVKKGSTVTITGTNFTNASLVSFGNQPTLNFTVVSPTLITAVVGNGADGYVSVTNSNGSGSLFGLVYVQVPLISPSGLTEFTAGTSVNLTAQYGANQSVKWFKDGVLIAGATSNSLNATESGVYTLTATYGAITETSPPVTLHAILPASSFKVAATSVTCKGSNNGIITVTATQNSNYRAIITSSGLSSTVNFSTTGSLPNLAPGTYNVCISPTAALSYQQCYTIIVTEPKDLALYAAVNDKSKTVSLTLTGGNSYNITINGSNYVSTSGIVTLPLAKGDNAISVTSDKICQGVLEKHIYISDDIAAYPNPFGNNLTLNLGSKPIANVVVVVLNAFGQQVYTNHFVNKSGEVVLDLSKLAGNQVYVLRLTADNSVFINKIVKK